MSSFYSYREIFFELQGVRASNKPFCPIKTVEKTHYYQAKREKKLDNKHPT